jgi:ribose transport system ATP-binding protein/inositol transport system ATP-binding protein
MIHQELNPVLDMSIAENIFLGRERRTRVGLLDGRLMREEADELLRRLGIPLRAHRSMRTLSVAQMQLVEIAKAIAVDSRVIIMDEPTSAITEDDVDVLFGHIARLRTAGVGIVYISHKMEEIFRVADTISVLRDGQLIRTAAASAMDEPTLISLMVGRTLDDTFPKREVPIGDPVLTVTDWSSPPLVKGVSIELRRGEVLGIGGAASSWNRSSASARGRAANRSSSTGDPSGSGGRRTRSGTASPS